VLKRILRSRRGEGYIDVCVLVLCAMLVIALAVQVYCQTAARYLCH